MNEFKLLGRLNWLQIQYLDNGTCKTTIYLGKKKPKIDEYETKDMKKRRKIELIGWNFKKVQWNAALNKYEDIKDCESEEYPPEADVA